MNATITSIKTLTRKVACAELRAIGYTGPVSYAMPKLRAIHAEVFAAAAAAAEAPAETARERKNRLERERRAARKLATKVA